jgi:hypothetical protein
MTLIRALFDPGKNINRSIEKVITYQASQEERLRAEISEYVVTDSIERQLEQLLEKMQAAMDTGGGYEVGVWVSGFYGSGKSSFTKYLGLAFDGRHKIDGQPFLKHLQDRCKSPKTRALLNTVSSRFPAAIVMLDLASEQIAGASLKEVSTVLYYKVLQYAGYARNLKVAAFERKLKKDGRYGEFEALFQEETDLDWSSYQNDPHVVDGSLPSLAHRLYPNLFKTEHAFTTTETDTIYMMNDLVREMIDIVQDASGKDNIIFVIDEIGQYVGSNSAKILDLQGLAQNLKDLGGGKVWIVGTAQQTLTEDDPKIAINSPELFKLKDRFPITVELESSDIREICYRRLLGKSPAGETELGNLFDRYGAQLRHNTKLVDAKAYDAKFDRDAFVNLYPFLPAHFDILLHLLGALAKSTGGIGLRSAIKVVQDILVEGAGQQKPVADQPVGWLATTVTLYDSLDRDIRRAFPQIHQAVEKVKLRVVDDVVKIAVAKTIALLQILNNLPVNVQNIAALMHPSADAESLADQVKAAVAALVKDTFIPLMEEQNGTVRFFSEKLTDIEKERAELTVRTADARRILNGALKDVFDPLPTAKVHGSLSVTSGIRHLVGGSPMSLSGERETVQTLVVFADAADYEAQKTRYTNDSRERANETTIYLIGKRSPEAEDLVADIYRCERIAELYRNDPDQEIRDYCTNQVEIAARRARDLGNVLQKSLAKGSFLFRGRPTAVDSLDQDLAKACRTHLAEAAEQVFDRYPEAPERADTSLAEKFLRAPNLRSITKPIDPLELVEIVGSQGRIRTGHKGLTSIRDVIERNGTVEGRILLDRFSSHPFGWSQDTLRYMIAALLLAGEIKLKVAGHEVTVNGQQAIDALKGNTTFKNVGVALRDDRPSMEVLARAATRLTELCGTQILPLEDEISKAAQKAMPELQAKLSPLSERLTTLALPGSDTVEAVNQQIAAMLQSDASDAPQRFGAEESPLYDGLKWAMAVKLAFDQGLSQTIKDLRSIETAIANLPKMGAPGELRAAVQEDLDLLRQRLAQTDFHKHQVDFRAGLTGLQGHVAEAVRSMRATQRERLQAAQSELARLEEWSAFSQEEREAMLQQIQSLALTVTEDLAGLRQLLAHEYDLTQMIEELKGRVVREGRDRLRPPTPTPPEKGGGGAGEGPIPKTARLLPLPRRIATARQLDAVIDQLHQLRAEIAFAEFDVTLTD